VAADRALAQQMQVRQVPSVHVRETGGWLRNGSLPELREQVQAQIDQVGIRRPLERQRARAGEHRR
jgi:hypothetical protein